MNILVLGGARDFHAVDWYRNIRDIDSNDNIYFLTDTISSEGLSYKYCPGDNIDNIFVVDQFLLKNNSKYTNIWRNTLKLLVVPIQVFLLIKYFNERKIDIVHAHPFYYMLLCFLSNIPYIGTPQGSEILIRPYRSKIYRFFAGIILSKAKMVTVDSLHMKTSVSNIATANVLLVQNGIDTSFFIKSSSNIKNIPICSVRGLTELYRIDNIFESRNKCLPKIPISTVYPFCNLDYSQFVKSLSRDIDTFQCNLFKKEFSRLLGQSLLVVSIPISDSSPRSVYEAIFSGAFVATTHLPWVEFLPPSMFSRLILCDIDLPNWLEVAYNTALSLSKNSFQPCAEAINNFDQFNTMKKFYINYHKIYKKY